MKGASEPTWDYEDALGGGMDLSRLDVWGGQSGQEHLEFEMAHRLHSLQVAGLCKLRACYHVIPSTSGRTATGPISVE